MPTYGFPDRGSYDRTRDAVRKVNREFPAAKRDPKTPKDVSAAGIRLAMTTAEHASGVEQAVNLCDNDWVESSDQVDAMNDALIAIPDDTKLYIKRFAGKWRVLQAFICEPE